MYLEGSLPGQVPGLQLVGSPGEADVVAVAAPRAGILELAGSVTDAGRMTVVVSDFSDREKTVLQREGVEALSFAEFVAFVRRLAPGEESSERAGPAQHAEPDRTVFPEAGERPANRGEADRPGMVIPVGSTKGGVGKSTVAVNLAVFLARLGTVVLVDFDASHGDVGATTYLDRRPAACVTNWGPGSVEALGVSPRAPEVRVLPFVDRGDRPFNGSVQLGREILATLRWHFDYVVVDLGVFSDLWCINAAIAAADVLVLVVDQSDKCLVEMTSFIHLESNAGSRSKMRLVVNKVGLEPIHTPGEIERALGFASHREVPFDPMVGRAVLRKTFPVLMEKSRAGRAMRGVFADLFGKGEEPARRRVPVAAIAAGSGILLLLAVLGYWLTQKPW